MISLPEHLRKYFWDVEFEKIDLRTHRAYVLQRILEYGDEEAVAWMRNHFDRKQVKEVLTRHRCLSPRSANYWALLYNIDRSKVPCLQKPYLEMRKRHWPY